MLRHPHPRRHTRYDRYDFYDDRHFAPSGYGYSPVKPYTFMGFMGDLFMILITGGLWLIWIFVREMRRR